MILLDEIQGDDIHEINRAEKIRQRTVFKFDHPRFEKYIQSIIRASDWIAMQNGNGEVTEDSLKRTYEKVKRRG